MAKEKFVTEPMLRKMIRKEAGDEQGAFATEHGVHPSGISAFMQKKQGAGLKIPAIFGLKPITVFVDKDSDLVHEPYRTKKAEPVQETKKSKKDKKKNKKK